MIDNNLIPYIKQNLNRGHSVSDIQTILIDHGHSSKNVLDTIIYIQENKRNVQKTHVKSNNTSKVLYILIPIILIILVSLSIFFFTTFSSKSISKEEFAQGTTFKLNENKDVKFNLGEEVHTIALDSVTHNSVSLTIQSDPIKVKLRIGEENKFDLDNDGFYDIKIKLNALVNGIPDIYIQKIHESTCFESWVCGSWSNCTKQEKQSRNCIDENSCEISKNKPSTNQHCTYIKPCIEDWICGSWSGCTGQGKQLRPCEDKNSCKTSKTKPPTIQNCTCVENWICDSWSNCTGQVNQVRTCTDINSCEIPKNKPSTIQDCIYVKKNNNNTLSYNVNSNFYEDSNDFLEYKFHTNETKDSIIISQYPNHEDSTILVTLLPYNLNNFDEYHNLGFMIHKENNTDKLFIGSFANSAHINDTIEKKAYSKVITNLDSESNYKICLSGLFKDFTTTGYFDCKNINTNKKEIEHALILINYDVNQTTRDLIEEWINLVENKNKNIKVSTYNIAEKTNIDSLHTKLREEYNSKNLNYLVFIGYDLPVPEVSNKLYRIDPYSSLSYIKRGEFLNEREGAKEVTMSVIRPENKDFNKYFERLIKYYNGQISFPKKLLLADAMIPSEKTLYKEDYLPYGYSENEIDLITGVESYSNDHNEGIWKKSYYEKLSDNKYQMIIINTHGSRTFHYPCYEGSCINQNFINEVNPKSKIIVGVSCNIGNFMTPKSPMVSYVFDGESMTGISGEVPFWDTGSAAKKLFDNLAKKNQNIGQASREFGFIVIGDPFIKLNS